MVLNKCKQHGNEVYKQHSPAPGGEGVSAVLLNANSKEHFLDDGIHPLFKVTTPIPITSCALLNATKFISKHLLIQTTLSSSKKRACRRLRGFAEWRYLIDRCLLKPLDAHAVNVNRAAHLPSVTEKQNIKADLK